MLMADPFELIKSCQPGMMLFGIGGPTEAEKAFVFLIREDERYVKRLGKYPGVTVRMGIFDEIAILFMVRFENNSDLTYNCWLNYHDKYSGYNLLKQQPNMIFKFFSARECVRTLAINNRFQTDLQDFEGKISGRPAWSMREFDAVKEKIYSTFTPEDLWRVLLKT